MITNFCKNVLEGLKENDLTLFLRFLSNHSNRINGFSCSMTIDKNSLIIHNHSGCDTPFIDHDFACNIWIRTFVLVEALQILFCKIGYA